MTSTGDELYSSLCEQFPKDVERQLKKGGASLTYIPVSEVINRLNKIFGVDGWSYEIIKCERDSLDPDFIIAHVRLNILTSVNIYTEKEHNVVITKDGFGGQKIKRTKSGEIVDLGDEFKGAVSDALKKAAQALGVGLYLARSEEALYAESIEAVDPKVDEMWEQFVELSKGMTAEQKKSLGEYWVEYSGNKPKPTRQTATFNDLQALIQWCITAHMEPAE